jgi:hypothetical protein
MVFRKSIRCGAKPFPIQTAFLEVFEAGHIDDI